MASPRADTRPLYDKITAHIVADLEAGVRPWTKPWTSQGGTIGLPLRHTGEPYRGINILLLWAEALTRGYTAPTWMTFRQALALGGHVRKGEHGATVVYAGQLPGRADNGDTDDGAVTTSRRFLRAYTVFNLAQIDGLPVVEAQPVAAIPARIAAADAVFVTAGVDIRHGGDQAFYLPSCDYVQMPELAAFSDAEAYYATLSHEAVHWTGHASRLDRTFGSQRWGDDGYAVEELVAELGAAFLCATLGLSLTPRTEHADYLGHWLKVLRADSRAIISAAAHAQRAVDHLLARLDSSPSAARPEGPP